VVLVLRFAAITVAPRGARSGADRCDGISPLAVLPLTVSGDVYDGGNRYTAKNTVGIGAMPGNAMNAGTAWAPGITGIAGRNETI
jgi:hypothetical protein